MLSHKFTLELSSLAKRDFRDVLSYTSQMWGEQQLAKYKGVVDSAPLAITKNPEAGHKKDKSELLFFRAGQHLIFYQVNGKTIFVVRILHGQMNVDFHLKETL